MTEPLKASQRYDLKRLPNGWWMVIDLFTGRAAIEDGVTLDRCEMGEVDDLVDLLNAREQKRIEQSL